MKSEMTFKDGKVFIKITDIIRGISRVFGPFEFTKADVIIRDSDKCREMFLS